MHSEAGEGAKLSALRAVGVVFVAFATLLWVAGCATGRGAIPGEVPLAGSLIEEYLVAGESAYFGARVSSSADLVAWVAESLGADVGVVIRRVDLVVGTINLSNPEAPVVSVIAYGRLPKGAARYALWRDRGFKRSVAHLDSGRIVYFAQADGPLEVAVPDSGTMLMSTGSVVSLASRKDLQSGGGIDPEIVALLSGAEEAGGPDIVIVFPEPASLLVGPLGLGIPSFPIVQLSLSATVIDAVEAGVPARTGAGESESPGAPDVSIELAGEFEFNSEMEARLFGRLGRIFILGFVRSLGLETGSLRETLSIEVDGTTLSFAGVTISPDELVKLAVRITGQEI